MFRRIVAILVVWGAVSVNADNHGCATDEKINTVDGNVASLNEMLNSTLNNDTLTDDEKNAMVLQKVCNDEGVRGEVDSIEMEVAACPALISMTHVSNLSLGALNFTSLFVQFQGVDNFCGCVPALMQAMVMNTVKDTLEYTKEGSPYAMIDVSALCASDAIKNAVMTVAMVHETTCKNVWTYADILNNNNVMIMNRFSELVCGSFDNTKFMCAVNGSIAMNFTECISDVDQSTGTNEGKKCERNQCVMTQIDSTCGDGRTWYRWAVNMEKNSADKFAIDNECDVSKGVTSAVLSSGLLVVAILTSLLF